jgi:hypothetical protein
MKDLPVCTSRPARRRARPARPTTAWRRPCRDRRASTGSARRPAGHAIITMKGVKAMSKKGAPTESLSPVSAFAHQRRRSCRRTPRSSRPSAAGCSAPARPSRLTARTRPPISAPAPARHRAPRLPPMARTSSSRMNTPRSGSTAKACTEVSTPERTMKVPSSESRRRGSPAGWSSFQRLALLDHDGRMQQRRRRPARA